jgi:hypothetical protein
MLPPHRLWAGPHCLQALAGQHPLLLTSRGRRRRDLFSSACSARLRRFKTPGGPRARQAGSRLRPAMSPEIRSRTCASCIRLIAGLLALNLPSMLRMPSRFVAARDRVISSVVSCRRSQHLLLAFAQPFPSPARYVAAVCPEFRTRGSTDGRRAARRCVHGRWGVAKFGSPATDDCDLSNPGLAPRRWFLRPASWHRSPYWCPCCGRPVGSAADRWLRRACLLVVWRTSVFDSGRAAERALHPRRHMRPLSIQHRGRTGGEIRRALSGRAGEGGRSMSARPAPPVELEMEGKAEAVARLQRSPGSSARPLW